MKKPTLNQVVFVIGSLICLSSSSLWSLPLINSSIQFDTEKVDIGLKLLMAGAIMIGSSIIAISIDSNKQSHPKQ